MAVAISVSTTIFMSIISLGFNGTVITIVGFPSGGAEAPYYFHTSLKLYGLSS